MTDSAHSHQGNASASIPKIDNDIVLIRGGNSDPKVNLRTLDARLKALEGPVTPPVTPPSAGPVISAVVATPTADGASIAWKLSAPGTGQVAYGPTPAYGSLTTKEPSYLPSHTQIISGLAPGTVVHYSVMSVDPAGNLSKSPDATFTVAAVVVTPPPVQTGSVAEFSGTDSAAWLKLLNDPTLDGVHCHDAIVHWHDLNLGINRDARPLLVTFDPTFIFDGTGAGGDGLMYAGIYENRLSHMRFMGMTIQNYTVGETGIITIGDAEHCAWSAGKSRNNHGSGDGQTSHVFYVATRLNSGGSGPSSPTAAGLDITISDWDHIGGDQMLSFLQLNDDPGPAGMVAQRNKIKTGRWGYVFRSNATGVLISDGTIDGFVTSFDSEATAGIVKNMKATNSGSPIINSPMVDGGGNSW